MWNKLIIWLRHRYHRIVQSIAFYPVLISGFFLLLSVVSIWFDFTDIGKQVKASLPWLALKDPDTARSIISAISAGIISLTVFSFSMVMIVLNQAAASMSNRILDKLIGNKFQQIVLGVYIGTIIFSLFLLTTIRDLDSGIHIPALSTYIVIFLAIADIFLFIYFIHYITQSVKYDVIIRRIYSKTKAAQQQACPLPAPDFVEDNPDISHHLVALRSGIYEGFDQDSLIKYCQEENVVVQFMQVPGVFILKDMPLAKTNKSLTSKQHESLMRSVFLHDDESIEMNFLYGYQQLTEGGPQGFESGHQRPRHGHY